MIKTILSVLGVDTASGPFTSNLKFTGGGVASSDANTLDAYVEGTATPVVTFGGGSTGMTFLSRGTTYTRIGNMVFFNTSFIFSAKGSSTGNVLISGMPVTASATAHFPAVVVYNDMANTVANVQVNAVVLANTATMEIYKYVSGVRTKLNDADFQDNTEVRINGCYRVS